MEQEKIFSVKNTKTIAVIAVIFMVLAISVSFLQTPKYQSSSRILVVFKQENIDSYSALKTSEYITGVLGEVIYSSSFVDSVIHSQFGLKDELGFDPKTRQKNWKNMVKVQIDNNRGLINLSVLNKDKDQANRFNEAIIYTLITKHAEYHGMGNAVELKVIDEPIVSQSWAQPKIAFNALLGLVIGWVVGFSIVILFPDQRILEFLFLQTKKKLIGDETINLVMEDEAEITVSFEPEKISEQNKTIESNEPEPESKDQNHYYNW